ncbi:hypothetical protein J3E69DRAFT_349358 [Trichoderma sp. SZMC 28015]
MSRFPHAGLLTHRLDLVHDALQQHQRGFSRAKRAAAVTSRGPVPNPSSFLFQH